MSYVEHIINAKAKDLGDNFLVRRSLPTAKKRMVGPFIFWDHMGPVTLSGDREMKVRAHPHIGLATITWLFSGQIMHRDSLGNEQMIKPGEVNWMTSGHGIVHSERSKPTEGPIHLEGIQLWIALPKEHEDIDPSFYHCKEEDVPAFNKDGVELHLIAGQGFGQKSPVPVYSDLFYFNGKAAENKTFHFDLRADQEGAVYIVDGHLEIEGKTHEKLSLITFKKGTAIDFKTLSEAQFMVFGGEVFAEKRHIWWNFVSTSEEKIERAKKKWIDQGFPRVINEEEFIPLPES